MWNTRFTFCDRSWGPAWGLSTINFDALRPSDLLEDVGNAWRAISNLVQADRALALLSAWGGSSALERGVARIFIP